MHWCHPADVFVPPVWSKAYDSLVGLYFAEPAPQVNSAFLAALGDNTIAERWENLLTARNSLPAMYGSTTVLAMVNTSA